MKETNPKTQKKEHDAWQEVISRLQSLTPFSREQFNKDPMVRELVKAIEKWAKLDAQLDKEAGEIRYLFNENKPTEFVTLVLCPRCKTENQEIRTDGIYNIYGECRKCQYNKKGF